jgi:hypothetical protein
MSTGYLLVEVRSNTEYDTEQDNVDAEVAAGSHLITSQRGETCTYELTKLRLDALVRKEKSKLYL